jgi:hypothetical protein
MDNVVDEVAKVVTRELRRIVLEAYEAFLGTLTASGDLTALDSIPTRWRLFVESDLGPVIGDLYTQGSMGAWLQASDARNIPAAVGEGVANVVNQSAVDYQRTATNRLVGIGDDVWGDVRFLTVNALGQDGVTTEDLKGQIEDITGMSEYRADTIARTETHQAVTAGDRRAAEALGEYGPVEHVWVAARDARTRESHAAAHNQVRPFGEPFDVGGVRMMRPGDGPVGEIVNCRCYEETLYPGDTRPDGTVVPEEETPSATGPWEPTTDFGKRMAKLAEKARLADDLPLSAVADYDAKTGRWMPTKALKDAERETRKMGRRVQNEVKERLARQGILEPESAPSMDELSRMGNVKFERFTRALREYVERETGQARVTFGDAKNWVEDNVPGTDTLDGLRRWLRSVDPEFDDISERYARAAAAYDNARDGKSVWNQAYLDELYRTLGEVRQMGGEGVDHAFTALSPHGHTAYGNAMRAYPKDWVESSARRGELRIGEDARHPELVDRGWHSIDQDGNSTVNIPAKRANDVGLAVHEVGHRMESVVPNMQAREWSFIRRRAGNEDVKPMSEMTGNASYGPDERGWRDEFNEPYAGKVYSDTPLSSWEILTMGMESLWRGNAWLDDDYRDFILGLLVSA